MSIPSETVRVIDSRTKAIATGTTSMTLSNFDMPFVLSQHPDKFTLQDTFSLSITNKGFKNIDRIASFLFDKLDMTVSLKPIAIPKLHLESRMRDLMKATENAPGPKPTLPGGAIGELLMGGIKVKIDIELIDQQGLKKFMEKLESQDKENNSDTEGEEDETAEE